jgi:UPF0755 protein
MTKFHHRKGLSLSDRRKIAIAAGLLLIIAFFGSAVLVRKAYQDNLKPLSSSNAGIVVTIKPGTAPGQIAVILKEKNVIRSDWAMEWYIRNHNLRDKLKAGTYLFKPSESVPEIAEAIASGDVATDLVTILPGRRLDQIRNDLIKAGFKPANVDKALEPSQYADSPALADKPEGASLEGYLYPESFEKTADTDASHIIKQSLDEMALHLTPDIRAAFNEKGLTVHEGVILASIVEQEVNNPTDRALAAQVFLKRLDMNMPLGSDVTAFYGAVKAGHEPSVGFDSPYNTRIHAGLPKGPISNVSDSSLKAVAYPSDTQWLYFVAGDNGKTYFSKTLTEHEALTKKYCKKLCN